MPQPRHVRPVSLRTVRLLLRERYDRMRTAGDHSAPVHLSVDRPELGDRLVILAPRIGALPYRWCYDGVKLLYCRPLAAK